MSQQRRDAVKKLSLLFLLPFLFWGFSSFLQNGFIDGIEVYITYIPTYEEALSDPLEHVFFVFPEGGIVGMTTYEDDRIVIPANIKTVLFEKYKKRLEDCILIIHNHDLLPRPSIEDKKVAIWLRGQGFTGRFAIYYRPEKRIIYYEDIEKN